MNKTALVMFSGGLDSTWVLWRMLSEAQYRVHAHHIDLKTCQDANRNLAEWTACNRIVDHLRLKMSHNFKYTTSTLSMPFTHSGADITHVLYVASQLALETRGDVVVMTGRVVEDDERHDRAGVPYTGDFIREVFRSIVTSWPKAWEGAIDPEVQCPAAHKRKPDLESELPREMADLAWSCRNPVVKDRIFHPCGECHSCVERRGEIFIPPERKPRW